MLRNWQFPSSRFLTALVAFVSLFLALGERAQAQTLRIMPLGDSITESQTGFASYRYWLWQDLASFGYCVNFVGGQTGVSGTPLFPDFDQAHEGHTGFRADQVLNNISGWTAAVNPDIVLMHLGTNDIWQGHSAASTVSELDQIIDEMRAIRPRVVVLVAQVIPMLPADIMPFNALLPGFVASKTTSASPVVLVDQFTGFDVNADTWDGVHPDQSGEIKMAAKWYEALEPFLLANNCFGTRYCFGGAGICPCGNDYSSAGCQNSAGVGALLSAAAGSTDAAADDLVLAITDMPPNKFGLVFMGGNQINTPFGDGRRCVGGVVKRFGVKQADATGTMIYGPGLANLAPVIVPASTWNYQAWYRDPMGGPCAGGFNLSNGLQVPFQP
ncbi:MAG: acyl-CoA thioesterase-1 [Chlamydiales bacterium]|jgi:acyl-CoA thioesterase-1